MARVNNLAYDYSIYENLPQRQSDRKIRVKKSRADSSVSLVKSFLFAATVLCLLCAIIYGKLEISKLYVDNTKIANQVTELEAENAVMETDIGRITSISSIEDYVENNLGLKKLDKSQIEYIQLQKDNEIEVVKNQNNNVFAIIGNWLKDAVEYIGF